MAVIIKCLNCGKEFKVINSRKNTAKFCCRACSDEYKRKNSDLNCTCSQCGKKFHMKQSQIDRYQRNMGTFCSRACAAKYRETWFKGENNHQFGLKGEKNASFKRTLLTRKNGNLEEVWISCPERPDLQKNTTRMTQHRYNVVTNPEKFDPIFFNKIGDFYVLKDDLHVHHKDLNHLNNNIDNLIVLKQNIHSKLHNQIKEISVDFLLKLIGVLKDGELLENPEVDNQQLSLSSNILESSETNSRIQTDNAEDSNVDTSAILRYIIKLTNDYIVQTKQMTEDAYKESKKVLYAENKSLESEIKSSE